MHKNIIMLAAGGVSAIVGYGALSLMQYIWPYPSPDVTLLIWMISMIISGVVLIMVYLKMLSWLE